MCIKYPSGNREDVLDLEFRREVLAGDINLGLTIEVFLKHRNARNPIRQWEQIEKRGGSHTEFWNFLIWKG